MTKTPSKKTLAVIVIAIAIATLAALSPVLLNSRTQSQGEKSAAAASKNRPGKQADTAIVNDENSVEEDSSSETTATESAASATATTATTPSNTQNQSAPDNDIPADGATPSTSSEDSGHPNNAGTATSPTSAPDNDIKAE